MHGKIRLKKKKTPSKLIFFFLLEYVPYRNYNPNKNVWHTHTYKKHK